MNVYHHTQLISLILATRNDTNFPAQGFPLPQQLTTSSSAKETEVIVQILPDVEPSIL